MISAFRTQLAALLAFVSVFTPLHVLAQAASEAPVANPPAPVPAEQPLAPVIQQAGAIPAHMLPHDLTPWQMFMDADIVVKAVMVGLAFASLVTWTVWLAKSVEIRFEKRRARSKNRWLEHAKSLSRGRTRIRQGEGPGGAARARGRA